MTKIPLAWLFPSSREDAKNLQHQLAEKICVEDRFEEIQWIGGMDVSCNRFDPHQMVYASSVVLDYHNLQMTEQQSVAEKQNFPYIIGYLGFREAPALIHTFHLLKTKPNLILVDGHGISHPRRLGIASHLGVLLDLPTIGVAKTLLVGKPVGILDEEPGSAVPVVWKNQTIAMLLRTKKRCNPLIISAGHRVSLETAVKIVQKCLRGYRLPEPTRHAHLTANTHRKSFCS